MGQPKLAGKLKDFLIDSGSIDAKVIDGNDVALKYGLQTKTQAAIECKDRSINDFFLLNEKFKELATSDDNCYALPYRDDLILVFDLTEGM
jgi:hypothetical protein